MKAIKHLYLKSAIILLALFSVLCGSPDRPDTGDVFNPVYRVTENITIYFTNPRHGTKMDDALIELINSQSTGAYLDVCVYGFNKSNLISALVSAIQRGVHLRFVGNKDGTDTVSSENGAYYEGYNSIASALDTCFPVGGSRTNFPNDTGFDDFILINSNIMHNKFILITTADGNKYLFTGTTNLTDTGFLRNNNNSLIIRDDGIFGTYRQQFEYLLELGGSTRVSSVVQHVIDEIAFDVIFSYTASDHKIDGKVPIQHQVNLVNSASSSIYFMIFSFTDTSSLFDPDLYDALISGHNRGLTVKGIFDSSQKAVSDEELLVQQGITCRTDGNTFYDDEYGGGKLHHKTMILDYNEDDAVVVTGSFNWSKSANESNDENMLFIHSRAVAEIYRSQWQYRWDEGTDL